jgi:hypothetical protein
MVGSIFWPDRRIVPAWTDLLNGEAWAMDKTTSNKAVVGLADAIDALRKELITAAGQGKDQTMRFSIEPVELTVQVAVTKDVDGKIGWELIGVGGGYEKVMTQTLTLKLAPLWKKPDGTLTTDFTISSPSFTGDHIGQDEG